MSRKIEIRQSLPTDTSLIEGLYPAAFPDEDLLPLARQLLTAEHGVLSLVAIVDGRMAGHVVFTRCSVDGHTEAVALLGPLAVAPEMQGQGIGTALVRTGMQRLESGGMAQVQVLGDPAYYGRFGFRPDDGADPPYPLPSEWMAAWQTVSLRAGKPSLRGALSVPGPWQQPALWLP